MLTLILIAALAAPQAPAKPAASPSPADAARAALWQGDLAIAAKLLDDALAAAPADADLLLLRAAARARQGQVDGALADLEAAARTGGPAASKARFREASLLDPLGRHAEALAATKTAVDLLRSPERRHGLVKAYVDAAHAIVDPPAGTDAGAFKPDWLNGKRLLDKAAELGASLDLAETIDFDALRCDVGMNAPADTVRTAARAYLERNPSGPPDHVAEARYRLVRAAVDLEDFAEARAEALRFAKDLPGDERAARALADLVTKVIASAPLWIDLRFELARELTEALLASIPADKARGANALIELADYAKALEDDGATRLALLERARALDPASPQAAEAELRIADDRIAADRVEDAVAQLDAFVAARTFDQYADRARKKAVDALFAAADLGARAAAILPAGAARNARIERARALYARATERDPSAERLPASMLAAANLDRLEGKIDAALAGYAALRSRFPDHALAVEATVASADLLVDEKHDEAAAFELLTRALAANKNGFGLERRRAQLLEQELTLSSERALRRDEAPVVQLATRNVETVAIACYEVDLREFFLATGTFDVLGRIDVSLIKPDATFDYAVAGFVKMRRCVNAVPLPALDADAIVVSARHGLMESRTLVLRTDLDAFAVLGAKTLQLFGLDRRAGTELAPTASRVAIGGTLLAPGAEIPSGQIAPSIAVDRERDLAVVSAPAIGLKPAAPAAEDAPVGRLLPERFAASPGETLRVLGALKSVGGDATLVWQDASTGRVLRQEVVKADAAGLFAAELKLDPALSGSRRVEAKLLGKDQKLLAIVAAEVGPRPDQPELALLPPVAPLRRGEGSVAFVRALDGSGRPLRGFELTYEVEHDAEVKARTDALGRIAIPIDAEHTRIGVDVDLVVTGEGVELRDSIEIERDDPGLEITGAALTAPRLVGDSIRFDVRATRPSGEAVAAPVQVGFERMDEMGTWRSVAPARDVALDASGRGSIEFAPQEAGMLRAVARVAGEHSAPIRAMLPFDAVATDRFQLVAPATMPIPGTTCTVRLVDPEGEGLALVLLADSRRCTARFVAMRRGVNDVAIEIPADCDRSLWVHAHALRGGRHVASSLRLEPEIDLHVALAETAAGAAGFRRAVTAVAKGPDGKPAAGARVALIVAPEERAASVESGLQQLVEPFARDADRDAFAVLASADFAGGTRQETWDPAIARAMNAIESAAADDSTVVMAQDAPLDELIGKGQGGMGHGKYGGRAGMAGRRAGGASQATGGGVGAGKRSRPLSDPLPAFTTAPATDAQGRTAADLSLDAPPGRYVLFALAVSADGRRGVTSMPLVIDVPIDVEVVAPEWMLRDDAPSITVAVGNRTGVERRETVRVSGAVSAELPLVLPPYGSARASFALATPAGAEASFQVAVGDRTIARTVRVRAIDAPLRMVVAGTLDAAAPAAQIAPDAAGAAPAELTLHASPLAALLDLAREPADSDAPLDLDAAAWRLYASAAALARLAPLGADAERAALQPEAEHRMAHLLAFLPAGAAQRDGSALALIALARAHDAGLAVPKAALEQVEAAVAADLEKTSDRSLRAFLLVASSCAGRADFAQLNRLLRDSDKLAPRDAALLALAFARAERMGEARTMLDRMKARAAEPGAALQLGAADARLDPLGADDDVAAVALSAAALAGDAAFAPAARSLLVGRMAQGKVGLAARALLLDGLASQVRRDAAARVERKGAAAAIVELPHAYSSVRAPLPAGITDLALRDAAAGAIVLWHAVQPLAGEEAPKPSTLTIRGRRRYLRETARRGGDDVRVGSSILEGDAHRAETPDASALIEGRPVTVWLTWACRDAPADDWRIFEPLPPGFELDRASLGNTEVAEVEGGFLLTHHRTRSGNAGEGFTYRVVPRVPGTFPARPMRLARGRDGEAMQLETDAPAAVTVVPFDGHPDDAIQPTPDERYRTGKLAYDRSDPAAALAWLLPLLELPVESKTLADAARMALDGALAKRDAAQIVRCFEILKELAPARVVGFDATRSVADAYEEIGELERARQVLQAVADATFLQEAQIVGLLEPIGRSRPAYAIMERLIAEYDDSSAVDATAFAFGQHAWYAAKEFEGATPDASDRLGPTELFALARRTLERWLADFGGGAAAASVDRQEEVALTLANVLIDMGQPQAASTAAERALSRIKSPRFLGTWNYLRAYAALASKDLEGALGFCRKLVAAQGEAEAAVAAQLADMGRHLIAQIHHARGELDAARAAYREIAPRVVDAARELAFLERQGLKVEPLAFGPAGEPIELEVEHRGVAAPLTAKIYPVDLRLLYLKQKSFDRLGEVELSGVAPAATARFELAPNAAKGRTTIALQFPAAGAWLVVLQAGDLHGRTMAIVGDLAMEISEFGDAVRAHVTLDSTGAPQDGVTVTFVGSQSGEFVTRKTDQRGIAEAVGLRGKPAVIAEWHGSYAFHQGENVLDTDKSEQRAAKDFEDDGYLQQSQQILNDSRARNDALWEENTHRNQQGVEVERSKK